MKQYQSLVREILDKGNRRGDRTGTGTIGLFGYQMRFDLADGFPLVTTKKVHWRSVVHELLWILRGESHIRYLRENGVTIWDEWASTDGEVGPMYGVQWRKAGRHRAVDQLADAIHTLRTNPTSRRIVINAWDIDSLPEERMPPAANVAMGNMALAPCHVLVQFYVESGRLSAQLYQRSADVFLGVPFNIASYALLVHMVAQVCGLGVGEFIHTIGDAHLYTNHLDQARELLARTPRPLPIVRLNKEIALIDDFRFEDFALEGYDPHPAIKADVSV